MQRDPRAFLWDAREAAQAIQSFTVGLDAKGYVCSELVQAAVERKFEVIGEALNQLTKLNATLAASIHEIFGVRFRLINKGVGVRASLFPPSRQSAEMPRSLRIKFPGTV